MAFIVMSSRSLTRTGVKPLSLQTVIVVAAVTMAVAAALALMAGIALGKHFSDEALQSAALANMRDSAEGRYTVERLGELSGKVLRLEQEASTLAEKIGALELFGDEAAPQPGKPTSTIKPQKTQPAALPNGGAAGGPQLPARLQPRLCALQGDATDMLLQEERVACLMKALSTIQTATATRSIAYMKFPARAPIEGVQPGSAFGNRVDPITGGIAFHSGLDFASPSGTLIRAAGGGTVAFAGYRSDMGNMIEIDHGSGLVTRYAHASKLNVRTGEVVTPGQIIANVGNTGRSTGPHLHFEILRNGQFVNPQHYLSFKLGG